MTEDPKKTKPGSKLARSEVITVRLDPKLRYLTGLAARMHRRTMSSYIEWALEKSLEDAWFEDAEGKRVTLSALANQLWDVDEADRFAKLALRQPHLLTHEEQVMWKLVRECGYLWRGSYAGTDKVWTWTVRDTSLIFPRLREVWDLLQQIANGDRSANDMPTWAKFEPASKVLKKPTGFEDMDDDIPF